MEIQERIALLENEVRQLAREHTENQQRLIRLFDELKLLKTQAGNGREEGSGDTAGNALRSYEGMKGTPAAGFNVPAQNGLEHFIGLRLIHLAGIIVLLTGISIGVKYAIDKDLISPLARIALAYLAGVVLFVVSRMLKTRYNFFSAILFSGSMASCYFTTYGALVYYNFLTTPAAFLVMVALTIFTIVQSIYYDRIEIALIGLVGAYGIPFLVSNNTGRIDLFFGYILLINVAVVFLGFRKAWKPVTKVALVITWSLFIGWLLLEYNESRHYVPAICYGIAFYLLFLIDAVTGRLFRKLPLSGSEATQVALMNALVYPVATVVFGPAGQLSAMVTGLMTVYIAAMALLTLAAMPDENKLFRFLAIESTGLLVLFIGLNWDGVVVTLLWVAVAVVLFVVGVFARQGWLRICSVLLVGATLLKLITIDAIRFTAGQRIISFIVIGILLLVGSFYYQRFNNTGNDASKIVVKNREVNPKA